MGVLHFFAWVRKTLARESVKISAPNQPIPVYPGTLCIDLNGVLHEAAQFVWHYGTYSDLGELKEAPKDEEVFERVIEIIEDLIERTGATALVVCGDGVAGAAKQAQQRQRRYKSGIDRIKSSSQRKKEGLAPAISFNNAKISPGTKWMFDLDKYMKPRMKALSKKMPVLYSSSSTPGEGEAKLFAWIRSRPPNERFIIHGKDADLIMLSLLDNHSIEVLRDDDELAVGVHVVDIDELSKDLVAYITDRSKSRVPAINDAQLVVDFVGMMFLVGNDFLPHSASLEIYDGAIDKLTDMYLASVVPTKKPLVDTKEKRFNRDSLSILFKEMQKSESRLILKKALNKRFRKDPLITQNVSVVDIGPDGENVKFNMQGYRRDYNKKHFKQGNPLSDAMSYLEGCDWVLGYYMEGIPSWNWYYPNLHAPLSHDLIKALTTYTPVSYGVTYPRDPWEQLLAILPPFSAHLLPKEFANTFTNNPKLYPTHPKINTDGKMAAWQGIVMVPFVSGRTLEELYHKVLTKMGGVNYASNSRQLSTYWMPNKKPMSIGWV